MEPHPLDLPGGPGRMSLYHRLLRMPSGLPTHRGSESVPRRPASIRRRNSAGTTTTTGGSIRGVLITGGLPYSNSFNQGAPDGRAPILQQEGTHHPTHITLPPPSPTLVRKVGSLPSGYTPLVEHVNQATRAAVDPMVLPPPTLTMDAPAPGGGQTRLNMTTDDFTRAVAVAAVSALREGAAADGARLRASGATSGVFDGGHHAAGGGGHGGHDAPSWSRSTSASVLLSCTLLYAIIAGK
jgi:Ca2+:H+ antiporter